MAHIVCVKRKGSSNTSLRRLIWAFAICLWNKHLFTRAGSIMKDFHFFKNHRTSFYALIKVFPKMGLAPPKAMLRLPMQKINQCHQQILHYWCNMYTKYDHCSFNDLWVINLTSRVATDTQMQCLDRQMYKRQMERWTPISSHAEAGKETRGPLATTLTWMYMKAIFSQNTVNVACKKN